MAIPIDDEPRAIYRVYSETMNIWRSKICALVLALAMTPGSVEIVENTGHLLAQGHLAHVEADGDRHEPSGPEHGCTPVFHVCGCHTSLAFLGPQPSPASNLGVIGFSSPPAPDPQLTGFWPSIDRPPQV